MAREHAAIRFARGFAIGAIAAVLFLAATGTVRVALKTIAGVFS